MRAIQDYSESRTHYFVTKIGGEAGQVLGDERVAVSTVRMWHAEYVKNGGVFRPDERGHYSRDILVMEEDIKQKFVKWSLLRAKADELSVQSARDFLNDELLITLDVCLLSLMSHAPPCPTASCDESLCSCCPSHRSRVR